MFSPPRRSRPRGRSWLISILAFPFVVLLWPPFYNHIQPELFGLPFFYWFQITFVLVMSLLLGILYFLEVDA